MTMCALSHLQRWHAESTSLLPHGIVVVGFSDTPASRTAALTQAAAVDEQSRIVLAMATTRPRPPRSDTIGHDALKVESYLLSERAIVDEKLRGAKESVARRTSAPVTTETVVDDPVHGLADIVARTRATAVVVGMGARRPSRQVRRMARALPDGVALYATDGRHHVRVMPRMTVPAGDRRPVLGPLPHPAGA
ncbi:universal stress protein [Gordonia sp. HNM0687]|uniref:Universal stress protein n=1 Tax=Gordonia mangrovi TaxID=2665643 RepID=A0A6L7GR90_9ACTN|nr:universal stress protein [Gordonia mangrovi]MXP22083.1 universal stress protein [Gordonia mangrovi]UVF77994.1 universal stress protein [Gordonia mangrovi]